jgi:hypothetical protein
MEIKMGRQLVNPVASFAERKACRQLQSEPLDHEAAVRNACEIRLNRTHAVKWGRTQRRGGRVASHTLIGA